MTERTRIDHFRTLVERDLGLSCGEDKRGQLAEVLLRRVAATGAPSVESYLARITPVSAGYLERRALAEELTVNETFFFRNENNFRALVSQILPQRTRRTTGTPLRILSAGCASGEEAYSIAIAVLEQGLRLVPEDVEIRAVDINPSTLARAVEARYSAWSLRATPTNVRDRYFLLRGSDFVLDQSVRAMVAFEEANLLDTNSNPWRTCYYDVVFCRNVLMYFTPEAMQKVVRSIEDSLAPGGYLFLGHAETLRGISRAFHLCHTHDTFYYQKLSEPPARAEPATPARLPTIAGERSSDVTWVDAIQHSTRRIAELADSLAPVRRPRSRARASEATPSPVQKDPPRLYEALRQERFSDALDLLASLPSETRDAPDALLLKAALLVNSGRLDDARRACERLLRLDELSAAAHYVMALCKEHCGDTTSAIEHDHMAIHLDPAFAMPHLHLGLMAKRIGDESTTAKELGEALALLATEDALRLLLFGGGFSRETLADLCRSELRTVGADRG